MYFIDLQFQEKITSENRAPSIEQRSEISNRSCDAKSDLLDSYTIVYESSPIQAVGYFRILIPYELDRNVISPIVNLEDSPREQSSNGLWLKGMNIDYVYPIQSRCVCILERNLFYDALSSPDVSQRIGRLLVAVFCHMYVF